jgi:Glycosyl hydrolases family 28
VAPVPVEGMTFIRASQIGCALDCDLRTGRNKYTGGLATDDGPRINAAMSGATASNPIKLIIDGSALISGLFMPAGGYWSIAGLGCGTGFFVKSGTNNDGIHNGPPGAAVPFNPGPPAPARGMNVSLSNFTLNGNQYGDSTTGLKQGTSELWYCGINLMSLDNITIDKVVVVNTPAFHFRLSNVGNVTVSGCVMKSIGLSTDGLHFDGPANDITISNCDFTTGDDAIALNCPEGYTGNINRVAVSNCTFHSLSLMRIYTTIGDYLKFYADAVNVSNCSGTFTEAAFLIGLANGSNPNSINLTVSDCSLAAFAALAIAENFGSITLTNVTLIPTRSILDWGPVPGPNHDSAFVRPSPLYGGITSVGSSLVFNNCTIYRNAHLAVAAVILENESTISNLAFNGFALQDANSYSSVPELIDVGSGSIGQLVLDSLDSNNINAPVSAGGFSNVGTVSGTGVLATGWEFPDAVMANEVPYISASTGLPSIKVEGVVEPYPLP